MPELQKVKTTRDYALFDSVIFQGTILYASRLDSSRYSDKCEIFNKEGALLGSIKGHYFDFAGQTLFEKVSD